MEDKKIIEIKKISVKKISDLPSDWNEKYDAMINKIGEIALREFNSSETKPKNIEVILTEDDNDFITEVEPEFYPVNALRSYFNKNFSNNIYVLKSVSVRSLGNSSIKFEFDYNNHLNNKPCNNH